MQYAISRRLRERMSGATAPRFRAMAERVSCGMLRSGANRVPAAMMPYLPAPSGALPGPAEALDTVLGNDASRCDALAYLWTAMESRQNLIVSGPAPATETMLMALAVFIPACDSVVVVSEDMSWAGACGPRCMVAACGEGPWRAPSSVQMSRAIALAPDRLMVPELRGAETRVLFSGANSGISFTAGMRPSPEPTGELGALTAGPMRVGSGGISALDVSMRMGSDCSILSISEYSWLSRAEAFEGEEICSEDMVSVRRVAGGDSCGSADRSSKVAAAYAYSHGISAGDAAAEMAERSALLRGTLGSCPAGSAAAAATAYRGW